MIVYRTLKSMLGDKCLPDCWKSENSKYQFPGLNVNDGLGYDFIIRKNKKTYHIEVKTTNGTNTQFEMGSSEIRQALTDAKKSNVDYCIAFIYDIFNNPSLVWLPNPFSKLG